MDRHLRILVADDEPEICNYFQKFLPQMGHRVVGVAHTGLDLVDKHRQSLPDLVITDIMMPGMDGIEAAAEMNRHHPIPIILISARYDAALIERAEANRVQGYLVKPLKSGDLEPMIAIALSRFEELKSLQQALGRIRQLQGLLPICMCCKKIRDDKNQWQQLEAYISRRSQAQFSHGLSRSAPKKCFIRVT